MQFIKDCIVKNWKILHRLVKKKLTLPTPTLGPPTRPLKMLILFRAKCPLPEDPEYGRWDCNSLQESKTLKSHKCSRTLPRAENVKNVNQSKIIIMMQGGITVCSLQCNMVGSNRTASCHLVIYKTRHLCSIMR